MTQVVAAACTWSSVLRLLSVGALLCLPPGYQLTGVRGMADYGDYEGLVLDPGLMSFQGEPRILDSIFNVTSITDGLFNNTLFQYAGVAILAIILFGE